MTTKKKTAAKSVKKTAPVKKAAGKANIPASKEFAHCFHHYFIDEEGDLKRRIEFKPRK